LYNILAALRSEWTTEDGMAGFLGQASS
jgi:hypothetical protein